MSKEVWKEVPGYDGKYFVSNHGRIKSMWRLRNLYIDGHERKNVRVYKERLMTPTDNGRGYLIVSLKNDGSRSSRYIHRLVAELFVENQNNMPVVNHIDFNKKNNNADNLEWCTQQHNIVHSIPNMRKQHAVACRELPPYIGVDKQGCYRVHIKRIPYKRFQNIEDAIAYRNEVFDEIGYSI